MTTRAQFLASHETFRQLLQTGDAGQITRFLRNHPDIAAAWQRITGGGQGGSGSQTQAPVQPAAPVFTGPPVYDPQTAPATGQYSLGYDSELDQEETDARGQMSSLLTNLGIDDANAELAWNAGTREVNNNAPTLYRRLLSNFAGRGMAYSSGYTTERQNTENSVADQLAALSTARTSTLSANAQRRADAQARLNETLAAIARRRAQRQS